jgi:hypothetical protein
VEKDPKRVETETDTNRAQTREEKRQSYAFSPNCLGPFRVAITKYLKLHTYKEIYLVHNSGGLEGLHTMAWHPVKGLLCHNMAEKQKGNWSHAKITKDGV